MINIVTDKSCQTNHSINFKVDMSSIFRRALIIEAAANIIGGVGFLFFPEWCLSKVIPPNQSQSILGPVIPQSTVTLLQTFATMIFALTVPLVICIPDYSGVAQRRSLTYLTLLAGEVFLTGLLIWKASQGEEKSGFTDFCLLLSTSVLTLPALWRIWVFTVKPHWFDPIRTKNT